MREGNLDEARLQITGDPRSIPELLAGKNLEEKQKEMLHRLELLEHPECVETQKYLVCLLLF